MRLAFVFLLMLPLIGQDYTVKALSRHALTNESIVALAQVGFDESFIVERIHTSRTSFSTNVDDLVALKKAGISEDVIRAMLAPGATAPAPAATPTQPIPMSALPLSVAPAAGESIEIKWWKYPWLRVRGLICR
jgi:hypothetical protein